MNEIADPKGSKPTRPKKSLRRKRGRPAGRTAGETRAKLIAAAEKHFDTRSYGDVRLDQIAETAGLSGPAIYNHFASKDDLFLASVIQRIRRYNDAVEKAVSIDGTWKDRYNNLLDAIRPLQGSGSGFQNITGLVMNRLKEKPDTFQEIRDLREESASYFRNLIAQGIDEEDFPPETDTVIAGDLLMAITTGASNTVTFYHPGSDELAADMLKTLLRTK